MISDSPLHKFSITAQSSNYEENGGDVPEDQVYCGGACLKLQFEYTSKYPEEPPIMEIIEPDNIDEEEDIPKLEEHLKEQVYNYYLLMILLYNNWNYFEPIISIVLAISNLVVSIFILL